MNYAELVDAVEEVTQRQDRPQRIQLAIAKATLKLHLFDFWQRDIVETTITVATDNAPIYTVSTADLERFRKLSYLHAWDPVGKAEMFALSEISPLKSRDVYGYKQDQGYYLAGSTLNIRSFFNISALLVGWYTLPSVEAATFNSWIAEIHPFAIIDEAAVEIFGSIGDIDEAKRREKLFLQNIQLIRTNEIEATGR